MAILQLEKALAMDPDMPEIHSDLAKLHMSAKRYTKATFHMERVLAKGSNKPADYFDLGKAYLAAEQYRKADSVLQILAKKAPTFTAGYLYLARANYYLNTPEVDTLHLPYYRKVIEGYSATPEKYKSSLLECYRSLAGYYFEKKKYPEARHFVEKVLELAPDDATAVEQLDYIKKVAAMPGGGGRG
jgi:tetratricopeptide (TPR) repeat protein